MGCREDLEAYLNENGVAFEVHEQRPAYTAQEVAAAGHVPGRMLAKVVMAVADGGLAMLVLPASLKVDFKRASSALGARELRLAHEDEFEAVFPGCELGAMPPFGNRYGTPVYVDSVLAEDERIVFQAGTHSETMTVRYADYSRLVKPAVVQISRAGA